MSFSAQDRQREIYLPGTSGQTPAVPVDLDQLEAQAKAKMSARAYTYIAGGAGKEETIHHNRTAFGQWRIQPRMLRDVSERDMSIELFGQKLASPFLLAPIGVLEMAHAEADIAVGRAAARFGIPMIFSNQASVPMEETAAAMGDAPYWFQLYWSKSNDLVASLVERAEKCGCGAIVVTLDTTMLGWRIQDLDLAHLPFLQGQGIAQYVSDPVFQKLLDEPEEATEQPKQKLNYDTIRNVVQLMRNYPGGFFENFRSRRPLKAVRKFIDIYTNPALNWDDLPFLRKHTNLPIILKGILHPDDARKAIDVGVDGLIVSNHGGRQVDGAISAIEALPEVVSSVEGQLPVLMDSGIRSGADAFKALALGAKAVCIGRPYVYGLTLGGEFGVAEVLKNMLADFDLTMGLAGCTSVEEIAASCLWKA